MGVSIISGQLDLQSGHMGIFLFDLSVKKVDFLLAAVWPRRSTHEQNLGP